MALTVKFIWSSSHGSASVSKVTSPWLSPECRSDATLLARAMGPLAFIDNKGCRSRSAAVSVTVNASSRELAA
jgi:hypothetical protein